MLSSIRVWCGKWTWTEGWKWTIDLGARLLALEALERERVAWPWFVRCGEFLGVVGGVVVEDQVEVEVLEGMVGEIEEGVEK